MGKYDKGERMIYADIIYASVDPASWLNPKFQKKTLTSLWGSLEGSFTKFVSGDEIVAQEPAPARKSTEIMSRPF